MKAEVTRACGHQEVVTMPRVMPVNDYWREVLYRFELALDLPELKGDSAILQDAEHIRARRVSQVLGRIIGLIEWEWQPLVVAAKLPAIMIALRDPEAHNWTKYECLHFREWVEQYDGKADAARKGHKPRPRRNRRNGAISVSQQD